jgi:AcrR family transcriptional regulator
VNKTAKPYHHGNLKEALVSAFIDLLEDTPFEKLSLRKLASHVGVAPTAVYNHFRSKDELQIAAKLNCMNHLADYLDECVINVSNPETKIVELGKAYYRYSQEHAQYFYFMMSTNIPEECITEELIETSMRAESALRSAIIDLLKAHDIPTNSYNEGLGTFGCWAVAHGISDLANKSLNLAACHSGRWSEEFMLQSSEQIDACFDAIGNMIVQGLLATARRESSKD